MSEIPKNWLPRSHRAERLAALVVVACVAAFEFAFAQAGLLASVGRLGFADDPVGSIFSCVFLVFTVWLFYRFILTAFTSTAAIRVIVLLILAVLLFAEFSYLRSIGRFTVVGDITYAITATSDQRSYSLATFASFAWLPVMAVALSLSIYFFHTKKERSGSKVFFRDAGIFGMSYVGLYFLAPILGGQGLYSSSFDAFAQTAVNYTISAPAAVAAPPKRTPLAQFAQANVRPANNVTFTSSQPSYDAFIVGASDEMLDSLSSQERSTLPTIFQYARSMNYKTWYLDGQMKAYWGGIEDDKRYIDEFFTLADLDPDRIEDYQQNNGKALTDENERHGLKQWDIDLVLAEKIRNIFESSSGNFVFVYKRGIHFPYEKNYPAENAVWQPVYKFTSQWETPPAEAHAGLTNSYDNALLHGTDPFFRKLELDRKLPYGTVIVYTSDHGETFASNGRAGHGGDSNDEASIPLFIIGLDRRQTERVAPAHHSNIFPTLLDLMNFPLERRNARYAPSLFDPAIKTLRPRYYHSGDGRRFVFEN